MKQISNSKCAAVVGGVLQYVTEVKLGENAVAQIQFQSLDDLNEFYETLKKGNGKTGKDQGLDFIVRKGIIEIEDADESGL